MSRLRHRPSNSGTSKWPGLGAGKRDNIYGETGIFYRAIEKFTPGLLGAIGLSARWVI